MRKNFYHPQRKIFLEGRGFLISGLIGDDKTFPESWPDDNELSRNSFYRITNFTYGELKYDLFMADGKTRPGEKSLLNYNDILFSPLPWRFQIVAVEIFQEKALFTCFEFAEDDTVEDSFQFWVDNFIDFNINIIQYLPDNSSDTKPKICKYNVHIHNSDKDAMLLFENPNEWFSQKMMSSEKAISLFPVTTVIIEKTGETPQTYLITKDYAILQD